MRTLPKLLIGGAAALAIAGVAGAAIRNTHVMTVRLPGGGVERIVYTGDVAPQVAFTAAAPVAFADPFAVMERMSAEMDRQTAAMLGQVDAMPGDPVLSAPLVSPDRLMQAKLREMSRLPAGAHGYSFVSTLSGSGLCNRSMEITSRGDGGEPTVVTHTSGNCAAAPAAPPPTRALGRPAGSRSPLMQTNWTPPRLGERGLHPEAALID